MNYHDELDNDDCPYGQEFRDGKCQPKEGMSARLLELQRYRHINNESFGILVKDVSVFPSIPLPSLMRDNDVFREYEHGRPDNRQLEALKLYHAKKDDPDFLMDVCAFLRISGTTNKPYAGLRMLVYDAITDSSSGTYAWNVDKFIEFASNYKVAPKKSIHIRWGHMIQYPIKAVSSIVNSHGANWDEDAYKKLKLKEPGGVVVLNEQYACTLFDDTTILIYDRKYKEPDPEPLWREEDLVANSTPYWEDKRTIIQHISTFIYNMLKPILVTG